MVGIDSGAEVPVQARVRPEQESGRGIAGEQGREAGVKANQLRGVG